MSQQAEAAEIGRGMMRARRELVAHLTGAESRAAATALAAGWLENPPPCLLTMDVHDLIEACYGVGLDASDRWLTIARVFEAVPVGRLAHGKRCALVALLRAQGETGLGTSDRRRHAA